MAVQEVWRDLLPGIPHDVTLTHIATKLPWTALHVLSSVSRSWQRAIQSREVHSARVRYEVAETLVVVKHRHVIEDQRSRVPNSISLYSMREKIFYALPPIPHLRGISRYSQFASVSGKLYVFGGDCRCQCYICSDGRWEENQQRLCTANLNTQLYVLDLAGQRQWEECAGIQEPAREYAVNIGFGCKVADQQYVRGGSIDWFNSSWQVCDSEVSDDPADKYEWRVERRDWRLVEPADMRNWSTNICRRLPSKFTVQGRYYLMRSCFWMKNAIFVEDSKPGSWTHKHSISCREVAHEIRLAFGPGHPNLDIVLLFILPVNNELLALASCYTDNYKHGDIILQSRGFGTERKKIVWEKAPHHVRFEVDSSLAICPIQL